MANLAHTPDAGLAGMLDFSVRPRHILTRLGWSSLAVALTRGKGIVTLPVSLVVLGVGGYGTVTTVFAVGSAIGPLALLNLPDGSARLIVGAESSDVAEARLAKIRGVAVVAGSCLGCAAGVALGLGSYIVAWGCLNAGASVIVKGGTAHLQYFQQAARLMRFTIAAEYLSIVGALGAGVAAGTTGYLAANTVIVGGVGIWAWRTTRARRGAVKDEGFWPRALRISLPLLPAAFAQWALFSIDAILVYDLRGHVAAGAYSTAYSLAAVGLILPVGLSTIWPQSAQRLLSAGAAQLEIALRIMLVVITAFGLGFVLAAWLLQPVLMVLLGGHALKVVPACTIWIVLGFALLGIARLFEGVLYASGRQIRILAAWVAAALVNFGLNIVWIPHWGALGAAYATAAGYGGLAALLLAVSRTATKGRS